MLILKLTGGEQVARPQKCRMICSKPRTTRFEPAGGSGKEPVVLGYDEYETIRLLDLVGYSQDECAAKMRVSRPTVTRMYESAREKIARSLVEARPLLIAGGDVVVCTQLRPECGNSPYCCHRAAAAETPDAQPRQGMPEDCATQDNETKGEEIR